MSNALNTDIVDKPLSVSESDYSGFSEVEKMALRLATWEQFARASRVVGTEGTRGGEEFDSGVSSPSLTRKENRHLKVTKAIIPVAGLGTRFLPATKSIPIELMALVDKPLIQYAVDEARAAGIEKFIFVTSRGKSALEDYFDRSPALEEALHKRGNDALADILKQTNMDSGSVAYVRQHEALGLGHAVWCAREFVGPDEPFAVILPDDVIMSEKPCLQQLMEAHAEVGGSVLAAMDIPIDRVSSHGIINVSEELGALARARGLVEKPSPEESPSNLAIMGRYILASSVFENLRSMKPGLGGEIHLTDGIAKEIEHGRSVTGLRFHGERFDCGSKQGLIEANILFALARDDLRGGISEFLHSHTHVMIQEEVSEMRKVINMFDYQKSKSA